MWTPTTRKQHSRRTNRYQSDLTDEEWFVGVADRFWMIFLRVPRFAAGNVRYGGNSRKHLLVARFSQFDPNQTWRFRVSPQMSSGVFSRIASTSTVIRRGRAGVLL